MGKISIDITIADNTETVYFTGDNAPTAEYYTGWTDMTANFFAGLTNNQLMEMAVRQTKKEFVGRFGTNKIFFLLYCEGKAPREIALTSGGVYMPQDIATDNTCPHADVTINGQTYKVFGIRFYQPEATDKITIKF